MIRYILLSLLLWSLASSVGATVLDRESDSLQLVNLYNSTEGDAWFMSWDLSQPMDTWQGVNLDTDGQVISIVLSNNNMKGALPVLVLPALLNLDLRNNLLRDTLPNLDGMHNVQFLILSNNDIDGRLYDFNLPNIGSLRLNENRIEGPIPNFTKMGKLNSLRLDKNELTGGIPNFTNLPNLFSLFASFNRLDGPIPEFAGSNQLLTLVLGDNEFTQSVPAFGNLTLLFTLDVSNNNLSGFLPNFSRLRQLETLRLNGNRFISTVVNANFGALQSLDYLSIADNLLEGPLPSLSGLDDLTEFDGSGNGFSGSIPTYVNLIKLQRLNLSRNNLEDTLPDLSHLLNLVELRVDSNQLSHVEYDAGNAESLQVIEVQNNRFTFSDLQALNALSFASNFTYSPQSRIPLLDTIIATIHDNVPIDLVVDEGMSNNTYQWFQDGDGVALTGVNELILININGLDQGLYHCIVKNDTWPALSLFSEEVRLVMICPVNEVPIVDTICGGDTLFVNGVGYTETGVYQDTLLVADPGTCDSVFIISLVVHPVYDTTILDTICESDNFMFDGLLVTESGLYSDTLSSINGCDSIVRLQLKVNEAFRMISVTTICAGDTAFVGQIAHTESGQYFDTLQTVFGCDSVIITDLTVVDTFMSMTQVSLCFGESYEYRGTVYDQGGVYIESFLNVAGCDSTYVLILDIPDIRDFFLSVSICDGDSVKVGDTIYMEEGIHIDTLINTDGCDSIVHLTLEIVDSYSIELDQMICTGDTLFFNGDTFTITTIYVDTLTARGGCDSIVKLRLTVVDFVPADIDTILCFGDSLVVGMNVYTSDGIYRDTLFGDACDTVVVSRIIISDPIVLDDVDLRLNNSNVGSIVPHISGGEGNLSYTWNTGSTNTVLDSIPAGDYNVTIRDGLGCHASYSFLLDQTTRTIDPNRLVMQLNLYPNPIKTGHSFSLETTDSKVGRYQIDLVDVLGRTVMHDVWQVQSPSSVKEMVAPSTGLYYLRVQNDKGQTISRRLMVH